MTKQLLLFWFASCQQLIIEKNPGIFKKQGNGDSDGDWGTLLLSLAGGLKDLDQISKQNYGSVFVYLEHLEQQRKKQVLRNKQR